MPIPVTQPNGGLWGSIPPWKLQIPGGKYGLLTCRQPKSTFFIWRSPPPKISGCVPGQYMPLHELGDHIWEKAITSCIRIGTAMKILMKQFKFKFRNLKQYEILTMKLYQS
jgi:hypothetical protein